MGLTGHFQTSSPVLMLSHYSTTADKTSSLAHGIIPGPSAAATALETALRAGFFGLNLACNAMMWALFTRALAAASSTVRVSVLNTTANFLVTAVLGWMWFDENIGGLWWIGAAGLAGGAAIVGQSRDDEPKVQLESDYHGPEESSLSPIKATSSGEEGSDALLGDMHAGDSDEDNPPSDRRPI